MAAILRTFLDEKLRDCFQRGGVWGSSASSIMEFLTICYHAYCDCKNHYLSNIIPFKIKKYSTVFMYL